MKTSVLQCGAGEDLLFLHGYGATKECFLRQINYFSSFYRVTAFDFWGFGESSSPSSPWSLYDYAARTAELLREYGVRRPHVIAHSFGARVAIKAEAIEPTFRSLILTGAAGIRLGHGPLYRLKVGTYRAVKRVAPRFADRHFGSEEYRKLDPIARETYKKIVNEDLRDLAEKIGIPTLLIYGERDKTTPVRAGMIYCSRIRRSELCVLPDCGHFPFLDDEVTFDRVAEEFWERQRE